MYNGLLVSSSFVIDKMYRDFAWDYTLQFNDILEWLGEALRELKVPCFYVDKVTDNNKDLNHQDFINIEDGRGKLPCDLFSITQTAAAVKVNTSLNKSNIAGLVYVDYNSEQSCYTGDGSMLCNSLIASNNNCNKEEECYTFLPMRWDTNTFYKSYHGTDIDFRVNSDLTYTVNNNYIFTSFKTGKVAMAYKAVPTDENGLPMIPDNQSVINYVTWYIGNKIAFQLYLTDKYTPQKYEEFKSYLALYYQKAKNEGKMPKNLDEWESYKNQRLRTIPKFFEHKKFFGNLQRPEERYNHPRISTLGGFSSRLAY
jgi:hypothetical protein